MDLCVFNLSPFFHTTTLDLLISVNKDRELKLFTDTVLLKSWVFSCHGSLSTTLSKATFSNNQKWSVLTSYSHPPLFQNIIIKRWQHLFTDPSCTSIISLSAVILFFWSKLTAFKQTATMRYDLFLLVKQLIAHQLTKDLISCLCLNNQCPKLSSP